MKKSLTRILVALLALSPALCSAADNPAKVIPKIQPLLDLVTANKRVEAEAILTTWKKGDTLTPLQSRYAEIALASFDNKAKMPEPSLIELGVASVSLSDCKWTDAKVGFGAIHRNIWMRTAPGPSFRFLETADGIHRKGLFAHAASEYVFDLGGRWEKLEGIAALGYKKGDLPYPYSSVDFIIEVDDKVVFSRRRNNGSAKPAEFSISVRNAKKLKFITTDAGNGMAGDHGLWISPTLSRPRR